jgi:hypothetical protein
LKIWVTKRNLFSLFWKTKAHHHLLRSLGKREGKEQPPPPHLRNNSMFFVKFVMVGSHIGHHPQEDLARFGYRTNRKLKVS